MLVMGGFFNHFGIFLYSLLVLGFGTFSVVPRIPGGEITADKLIAIGSVAKKYGLYCKITGAQRIDMFGAKKQDLLNIWTELVDAGMESGHAYAKALRAIKVR